MAQPSAAQRAWRGRIEAVLAVVAPALDAFLAAGDRLSRTVERDDLDWVPPRRSLGGGYGTADTAGTAGERPTT